MGIKWVEPLVTIVVPIDYAKSKDLKENLESLLIRSKDDKPRGSVRVDEFSNSLIISAIKDDLLKMMPISSRSTSRLPRSKSRQYRRDDQGNGSAAWHPVGGMYSTTISKQNLWITPGGYGGSTTVNPLTGAYTSTSGSMGLSVRDSQPISLQR